MNSKPFKIVVHETYEIDQSLETTFEREYQTLGEAEFVAKEIAEYVGNVYGTNYIEIIDSESEVISEVEGVYRPDNGWLTLDIIVSIEQKYKA